MVEIKLVLIQLIITAEYSIYESLRHLLKAYGGQFSKILNSTIMCY